MSVVGILGKKIGMTQVFDERSDIHPVTVLKAGPCVVTQLKTLAKDGYDAAQIVFFFMLKTAYEITGRLAHEIKEARLCLGDESPNIRMALDRLKQMEKWLS